MIDTRHLAILREVHRQGSVTRAAGKLNVSQSALSHTIKKIEDYYCVKIWTKKGRSLYFTPAGEYLLSLAERVLPQFEEAEAVLNKLATGKKGSLRAGMECHPCEAWLMRVLAPYLIDWPDVDFEVRTASSFDGVSALLNHEIDLLITPDPVVQSELMFTPVFDYELLLVVHSEHPLALQQTVTPENFLGENLITVPVSIDRLDVYTRFLIPAGCKPGSHTTAETTELILQLVAAQRGIAVLPDWLIHEKGQNLPIDMLKIGEEGLYKSIHIGIRKGEESVDFIEGFLLQATNTIDK
jgi:LysR family transcriptional regulator for metE and metH